MAVLTDEDFANLPLSTLKTVEVVQFVDEAEVDPTFFQRTYFLEAEAAGSSEVTAEHLQRAFTDFIPTTNNLERELQILAAILECTSRELLPERFRDIDRAAVQLRLSEIKLELRTL